MKRNLRFWTRYTWESAGGILMLTLALGFFALLGAEGLDVRTFVTAMPYMLCISAILVMLMINIGSQTLYVPLLLSMGELRRNVLLGFHYYRALIIAVTLALCGAVWLIAPGEVSGVGLKSLPTILCILIAAASVGSIMGTLFVKWKWLGLIILILLCGGAGGTMGFAASSLVHGSFMEGTLGLASGLVTLPWWLVVIALAALALDIVFQWLLLRRQEVKL